MPWDAKTAGYAPCRGMVDLRLFVVGELVAVKVAVALMPAGEPLGQQREDSEYRRQPRDETDDFPQSFHNGLLLGFLSLYHGEGAFVNGGKFKRGLRFIKGLHYGSPFEIYLLFSDSVSSMIYIRVPVLK